MCSFAQVATVTSRQAEPLTYIKPYLKFDLQQVKGSRSVRKHWKPLQFTVHQKSLSLYANAFSIKNKPKFSLQLNYFTFNWIKNEL